MPTRFIDPGPFIATTPELVVTARRLATASTQLSEAVAPLEAYLKELNLGVEAWVPSAAPEYEFGYAKVEGRWGVAIRETAVSRFTWLFAQAPRPARLAGLSAVPALLEQLNASALALALAIEDRLKQNRTRTLEEAAADARAAVAAKERV
jgi:hypothetical protein